MTIRQIIVTDYTRMEEPNVCLAGIDIQTHELLRPLHNNYDYLTKSECMIRKIHPGCLITANFGNLKNSQPPHVEDINWDKNSCLVNEIPHKQFYDILKDSLAPSIQKGFGVPINDKSIIPSNAPNKSIITIKPKSIQLNIEFWEKKKVKATIQDGDNNIKHLSINDLNLYSDINNNDDITRYNSILTQNISECYIRIGLTRVKNLGQGDCLWLQINGIYVFDGQGNRIV